MCFAYGYIIQDILGADGKSYFAIVDENENEIIAPTEGDILISSYNSSKKYTGTEKNLVL